MPKNYDLAVEAALQLLGKRKSMGWTKSQLANKLGVSVSRYSNWEKAFGPLPQRQYGDALNRIFLTSDFVSTTASVSTQLPVQQELLSREDHTSLAKRAANQRESLGLTRGSLSREIGVSYGTLKSWEEHFPQRHRGVAEDLWEDALRVPRGWLRNLSSQSTDDAVSSAHCLDLTDANMTSVSEEIRAVGIWLSRKLGHVRTTDRDQLNTQERVRADSFALRFGVNGDESSTLQAIGTEMGLTRERIRQILERMTERADGVRFVLPRLNELRHIVDQTGVGSVVEFESRQRQLLGERLTLATCDAFARQLLAVSVASVTAWAMRQTGNALQPMVSAYAIDVALVVRDCSRRMIRSSGAAHVLFVTGMVSDALKKEVSVATVLSSLLAIEGMEWLSADKDWYWFGLETAGNRALDTARRALAVAGRRLDVEELHQGFCRARRHKYDDNQTTPPAIEAPQWVLLELYLRVPWLRVVQHNDFILTDPVAECDVLSESEMAVVNVIRENGGVASRKMVSTALVNTAGMSVPTVQFVLVNSPVVRSLGFGLFGLRGVQFSEESLTKAKATLGSSVSRNIDSDANGWIHFEMKISAYHCEVGVIDFPARVASALPAGEYVLAGLVSGTVKVGSIKSAHTRVSGFIACLRRGNRAYPQELSICVKPNERSILLSEISPA